LYISYIFLGRLRFFNKILLTYQKNKNKDYLVTSIHQLLPGFDQKNLFELGIIETNDEASKIVKGNSQEKRLFFLFLFFDKSEEYIKKRKRVQPLVHREYTKGD
jgi:hypothetical protein